MELSESATHSDERVARQQAYRKLVDAGNRAGVVLHDVKFGRPKQTRGGIRVTASAWIQIGPNRDDPRPGKRGR